MKRYKIKTLSALEEFVKKHKAQFDTPHCFAFKGEMGSGKTTLIQLLLKTFGINDLQGSPTYAIVNQYYNETTDKQVFINDIVPVSMKVRALDIDTFSFVGLYEGNQMNGSNSIPQAQSKAEWILAAKNKIGAWCYIDTLDKLGVLYNGYSIANIAFKNNVLLADSIYQGFENTIQAKSEQLRNYDSLLMIERNSNGNFYNLGYHSFWVGPESNSGTNHIISVDQINGDIKVRPVNPGNGYFIRLLK